MKQTAVEWLVEQICVSVPMYDSDDNEPNIEYWNAYKGGFDLSNFINKAKEMEKQQQGYSEEEVFNLIEKAIEDKYANLRYWFEQFKKK